MKILSLIEQIGNFGNRPDLAKWREEITEEAEKLIAVVKAAKGINDYDCSKPNMPALCPWDELKKALDNLYGEAR